MKMKHYILATVISIIFISLMVLGVWMRYETNKERFPHEPTWMHFMR